MRLTGLITYFVFHWSNYFQKQSNLLSSFLKIEPPLEIISVYSINNIVHVVHKLLTNYRIGNEKKHNKMQRIFGEQVLK